MNAVLERRVSGLCAAAGLSERAAARLRHSVDGRWIEVADDLREALSDDETLALAVSVEAGGERRRGVLVGRPMLRPYVRHTREVAAPRHIPLRSCAAAGALADGNHMIVYVGGDVSLELIDVWLWRVRAMLPVLGHTAARSEESLIDAVLESIAGHEEEHVRTGWLHGCADVAAAAASDRAADAYAAMRCSDDAVWMIAAYHFWAVANGRRIAGSKWPEELWRDPDWLNGALITSAVSSQERWSAGSIRATLQTAMRDVSISDSLAAALDDARRRCAAYGSTLTAPPAVIEAARALAEAMSSCAS